MNSNAQNFGSRRKHPAWPSYFICSVALLSALGLIGLPLWRMLTCFDVVSTDPYLITRIHELISWLSRLVLLVAIGVCKYEYSVCYLVVQLSNKFLKICRMHSLQSQLWRTILRKFPCLPPLFILLNVDFNTPRHSLRWFLLSLSAVNGWPNALFVYPRSSTTSARAHHSHAYDRRNAASPNDPLQKSWISLTVLPRFVPEFQTNTPYR